MSYLLKILMNLVLKVYAVTQLVETLRYKLEGRGFDSRGDHSSGRTVALGSTQPVTEMRSRNIR